MNYVLFKSDESDYLSEQGLFSRTQHQSFYQNKSTPVIMSSPIVFITGANTGLGFETIRSLLRSQKTYNIILGGRNIAKADDAVQKLRSEYPTSKTAIASVQVDVEDDASIKKAFDHISIIYGQIDVLINNAGRIAHFILYSHYTYNAFNRGAVR